MAAPGLCRLHTCVSLVSGIESHTSQRACERWSYVTHPIITVLAVKGDERTRRKASVVVEMSLSNFVRVSSKVCTASFSWCPGHWKHLRGEEIKQLRHKTQYTTPATINYWYLRSLCIHVPTIIDFYDPWYLRSLIPTIFDTYVPWYKLSKMPMTIDVYDYWCVARSALST